ncbi:MAG TPA: WD40 repeat domain-containing protein, partial [Sulfurimonas autotrophica]|nr:WD40 repeat domain-containing protein [Sulfurimonas autotrophica]
MQQNKCLKFRADILDIGTINDNFIAVASQNQNIKIIAPIKCKVLHNLYFDLLGKNTTAIAFHPTQDIIAIANGEVLYILDATHRNIMHTIQTHSGAIRLLTFLPNTSYLICGTVNGRV